MNTFKKDLSGNGNATEVCTNMERDIGSGRGITVAMIGTEGIERATETGKEVKTGKLTETEYENATETEIDGEETNTLRTIEDHEWSLLIESEELITAPRNLVDQGTEMVVGTETTDEITKDI